MKNITLTPHALLAGLIYINIAGAALAAVGASGGSSAGGGTSGAASAGVSGTSTSGTSMGTPGTTTISGTGTPTGTTGAITGSSTNNMTGGTTATTSTNNWNAQNQYWQSNYSSRTYYNSSTNYSTYEPAYQFGYNMYNQNTGKRYSDLNQSQLRSQWESNHGNSTLTWDQANNAARDSYDRMYNQKNSIAPAN